MRDTKGDKSNKLVASPSSSSSSSSSIGGGLATTRGGGGGEICGSDGGHIGEGGRNDGKLGGEPKPCKEGTKSDRSTSAGRVVLGNELLLGIAKVLGLGVSLDRVSLEEIEENEGCCPDSLSPVIDEFDKRSKDARTRSPAAEPTVELEGTRSVCGGLGGKELLEEVLSGGFGTANTPEDGETGLASAVILLDLINALEEFDLPAGVIIRCRPAVPGEVALLGLLIDTPETSEAPSACMIALLAIEAGRGGLLGGLPEGEPQGEPERLEFADE